MALLFTVTAATWSFVIPVGEAPDEGAHLRYAEYIWVTKTLPDARAARERNLVEALQPPLYHVLLAVGIGITGFSDRDMVWVPNPRYDGTPRRGSANINDNAAVRAATPARTIAAYHLLRLFNAVLGGLTVWWLWRGITLATDAPALALLSVSLWAGTAQAAFMSGVIGNDILAACLSAWSFVLLMKGHKSDSPWRALAASAIVLSLALLTKTTTLLLWGTLLVFGLRRRKQDLVRTGLWLFIPALLAGWSVARSLRLHDLGQLVARVEAGGGGLTHVAKAYAISMLKTLQSSFYSGIALPGVATVYFPGWYYGLYAAVLLLISAGVWRVTHARAWREPSRIGFAFAGASAILFAAATVLFWDLASRLYYVYLPGLLTVAASVMDFEIKTSDVKSSKPRWSSLLLIISGISGVLSLLPQTFWNPLMERWVVWAHVGHETEYYSDLIRRYFSLVFVAGVIIWWWNAHGRAFFPRIFASDRGLAAAVITSGGLILLNLMMLLFYVAPFYS
jgi:hypothetical protein